MHYFSVYVGCSNVPSDRVEGFLKKTKEYCLKSARDDERFFFLANPNSDVTHIVKLDKPPKPVKPLDDLKDDFKKLA